MRAWTEINLDAIKNNIKYIRKRTSPQAQVMAIVKADAYGHGVCDVTATLLANGADRLGVATVDEAIQLRNAGFDVPILILGYIPPEDIGRAIEADITLTVFHDEYAETVSQKALALGKKCKIHIKLDTGMHRIGYLCTDNEENTVSSICRIAKLSGIQPEGIFSHFAKADEADPSYTHLQFGRFCKITDKLEEMGIHIPIKHICNSAGILKYPEYHMDMVRSGIITYGLTPNDEMDISDTELVPAMSFKSIVANIKTITEDAPISYGGRFVAKPGSKIATINVGYADGYSRVLSNKAQVLINGHKVNIVGNVCMDQMMADVTEIENINIGDEVILFGSDGNNNITVESVASLLGTINYETVCVVGKRVPRVYIQDGKEVNVLNYLA